MSHKMIIKNINDSDRPDKNEKKKICERIFFLIFTVFSKHLAVCMNEKVLHVYSLTDCDVDLDADNSVNILW